MRPQQLVSSLSWWWLFSRWRSVPVASAMCVLGPAWYLCPAPRTTLPEDHHSFLHHTPSVARITNTTHLIWCQLLDLIDRVWGKFKAFHGAFRFTQPECSPIPATPPSSPRNSAYNQSPSPNTGLLASPTTQLCLIHVCPNNLHKMPKQTEEILRLTLFSSLPPIL